MKRNLILLVAAIGIVAISSGCSSQDAQVPENKVAQLEQQLSSQNAENREVAQSAPANNTIIITPTFTAPAAQNSSESQLNHDTTGRTNKVDTVVQLADGVQPKTICHENVSLLIR